MTDPHWTSYVGMGTGIVGSILGFIGYWTSKKHKSQDLRIELKKSLSSANNLVRYLIEFMGDAKSSRINIDAANGKSKSGGSEIWKKEFEQDKSKVGELGNQLAISHKTIDSMNDKILEKSLVEVHRIANVLESVKEKYINFDSETKRQVAARSEDFKRRHK